jgi:hypothetical protein
MCPKRCSSVKVRAGRGKGLTRRRLFWGLPLLAALGLGVRYAWRHLFTDSLESRDVQAELVSAVLDGLLPDGNMPGHRATDIQDQVLEDFRSDPRSHSALLDGLSYVDQAAVNRGAESFLALDTRGRAEVLEEMARAPHGSAAWFFYGYLRERAMLRHYSHPSTWAALGFRHPPQPKGYYDYREPPNRRS